MANSTIRLLDSILLFFIFTFSAALLIAIVSIFGYATPLSTALPVAGLGGLSAGFLGLVISLIVNGPLTRPRNVPNALRSEIDRAGRPITSG